MNFMVRSAAKQRVSNHGGISGRPHLSRRRFRAPQDEGGNERYSAASEARAGFLFAQ